MNSDTSEERKREEKRKDPLRRFRYFTLMVCDIKLRFEIIGKLEGENMDRKKMNRERRGTS